VKEEDTDWQIYHQIPQTGLVTVCDLAARNGLDPGVVEASLARLERSCLVERKGDAVRLLSFGEALIHNQVKYEKDLPFMIENGVIKERKK
jgi:Mn-dependent DtxR family transcriptional regulator